MNDRRPPSRNGILRQERPSQAVYRRRRIVVSILFFVLIGLLYLAFSAAAHLLSGLAPKADVTPKDTVSQSQTPTTPADPNQVEWCHSDQLELKVVIDNGDTFGPTDDIVIHATIGNISQTACRRDVGSHANEIFATTEGGRVVWSSDRCATKDEKNIVVMNPGSIYRVPLQWSGNSNPTVCGRTGKHVPAGKYRIVFRNNKQKSEPTIITMN